MLAAADRRRKYLQIQSEQGLKGNRMACEIMQLQKSCLYTHTTLSGWLPIFMRLPLPKRAFTSRITPSSAFACAPQQHAQIKHL